MVFPEWVENIICLKEFNMVMCVYYSHCSLFEGRGVSGMVPAGVEEESELELRKYGS